MGKICIFSTNLSIFFPIFSINMLQKCKFVDIKNLCGFIANDSSPKNSSILLLYEFFKAKLAPVTNPTNHSFHNLVILHDLIGVSRLGERICGPNLKHDFKRDDPIQNEEHTFSQISNVIDKMSRPYDSLLDSIREFEYFNDVPIAQYWNFTQQILTRLISFVVVICQFEDETAMSKHQNSTILSANQLIWSLLRFKFFTNDPFGIEGLIFGNFDNFWSVLINHCRRSFNHQNHSVIVFTFFENFLVFVKLFHLEPILDKSE